jgi:LysM repeat protein
VLLLFALAFTRNHVATAKIVLEEPQGEVGAILYHGAAGHYHVVRPGETLSAIAQQYGLTIGQIMANNWQIHNPHLIYAGHSIWIPAHGSAGTGGGGNGIYDCSHYVRYGDSLFGIAYYYGVNLNQIMAVNGIIDPDYIYAGTVLYIPCR